MFNLLRGHTEGVAVLDAFCGTGPIGIEALSRGAARCVFVERDAKTAAVLERNLAELGLTDRTEIVRGDALGPGTLARCPSPVHLAFFDPPYPMARSSEAWQRVLLQLARVGSKLTADGYLVVRTPWPFWHEGGAADEPTATGRRGRGQGAGGRGARTPRTVSVSLDDAGADDLLDAFEAELEKAAEGVEAEPDGESGASGGPEKSRSRGVLAIPGLIGPETHPYGHTAVHLYMRAPDA
mgnify:FL=1